MILINILISLTKAAISADINNWLASRGGRVGRRGKSNQSFKTLIFPSQQLPPMTVIYMANRQYYVYKIVLGKEDLNDFCQSSKGAGIGSDAGGFFPLLSSMHISPRCLAMQQPIVPLQAHTNLWSTWSPSCNNLNSLTAGLPEPLWQRKIPIKQEIMESSRQPQIPHPMPHFLPHCWR